MYLNITYNIKNILVFFFIFRNNKQRLQRRLFPRLSNISHNMDHLRSRLHCDAAWFHHQRHAIRTSASIRTEIRLSTEINTKQNITRIHERHCGHKEDNK